MQKLNIFFIAVCSLFFSCNKSEDPVDLLSGLSKGAGTVFVTGAETFSHVNDEFHFISQYSNRRIAGNQYSGIELVYGESGVSSIYFVFLIPEQEESRVPPNGDLSILERINADPEGRSTVEIRVGGFSTSRLTTGKLTVVNSQNSENSFDVIFNLQNLWDDNEEEFVNIEGAFRF